MCFRVLINMIRRNDLDKVPTHTEEGDHRYVNTGFNVIQLERKYQVKRVGISRVA